MSRQKMEAKNCWFVREDGYISEATGQYVSGKSLNLKFISEGKTYSVLLKAAGQGNWAGEYTVGGVTRPVTAKLYKAEDESMVLVGTWAEDTYEYTWLVDDIVLDDEDDGGR